MHDTKEKMPSEQWWKKNSDPELLKHRQCNFCWTAATVAHGTLRYNPLANSCLKQLSALKPRNHEELDILLNWECIPSKQITRSMSRVTKYKWSSIIKSVHGLSNISHIYIKRLLTLAKIYYCYWLCGLSWPRGYKAINWWQIWVYWLYWIKH